MFQHVTNEPEAALSAPLASSVTPAAVTHPEWLCTSRLEVGQKQKRLKCIRHSPYFVETNRTGNRDYLFQKSN